MTVPEPCGSVAAAELARKRLRRLGILLIQTRFIGHMRPPSCSLPTSNRIGPGLLVLAYAHTVFHPIFCSVVSSAPAHCASTKRSLDF